MADGWSVLSVMCDAFSSIGEYRDLRIGDVCAKSNNTFDTRTQTRWPPNGPGEQSERVSSQKTV